jgi:murein DD-endopeptidase MepM/ murein hydrolase activator NlpD
MPQRSYPLAREGRINGRPFQGAHTIRNPDGTYQWQSCRAFDLNTPIGTPVLAIWDGVIGQRFGPLSTTDPRFEGLRCYVEVPRGNQFYYAHLSRFASGISPGVRVTSGQVIGFSGKANGVPHLHVACRSGDPEVKLLSGKITVLPKLRVLLSPSQALAAIRPAEDGPEDWECVNPVPPGEGEAAPEGDTES